MTDSVPPVTTGDSIELEKRAIGFPDDARTLPEARAESENLTRQLDSLILKRNASVTRTTRKVIIISMTSFLALAIRVAIGAIALLKLPIELPGLLTPAVELISFLGVIFIASAAIDAEKDLQKHHIESMTLAAGHITNLFALLQGVTFYAEKLKGIADESISMNKSLSSDFRQLKASLANDAASGVFTNLSRRLGGRPQGRTSASYLSNGKVIPSGDVQPIVAAARKMIDSEGVTQTEAARRLDISLTTLRDWLTKY